MGRILGLELYLDVSRMSCNLTRNRSPRSDCHPEAAGQPEDDDSDYGEH